MYKTRLGKLQREDMQQQRHTTRHTVAIMISKLSERQIRKKKIKIGTRKEEPLHLFYYYFEA